MAFKSYGGLTWTDQQTPDYHGGTNQLLAMTLATGLGAGATYLATRENAMGSRPIDYIAAYARNLGNRSPLQLLNTFRIPEIISPLTSLLYKGGEGIGSTVWTKEMLSNDSTYDWLKYVTGLDDNALKESGIVKNMKGDGLANAIIWEQEGKNISGSLYSITGGEFDEAAKKWIGGERKLLSHDINLQAISHEVVNPFSKVRGVNRIAASIFAAAGMYAEDSFNPNEILTNVSTKERSAFMFTPSAKGPISSIADIGRRTLHLRGLLSFSMDRFNTLIGGVSEQFLGKEGSKNLNKLLGVTTSVRPGTASTMFARFGGRAAAVGAGALALGQIDWIRRQFSLPGQIVASGAIGTAIAHSVNKITGNPRYGVMAGVASFFGQMILPGFKQGIIPGLATAGVNLDIMRANGANPFNYIRRTLEGFAPGITDPTTGALFALGVVGASSLRLPGLGKSFAQHILERTAITDGNVIDRLKLLLPTDDIAGVRVANSSLNDFYWKQVGNLNPYFEMPHSTFEERRALMQFLKEGEYKGDSLRLVKDLNSAFYRAEEELENARRANPMNDALERRLSQIASDYKGDRGILNSIKREVRGMFAQAHYSFFGANLNYANEAARRRILDMGFGALGKIPGPVGKLGKLATVGGAAFLFHGIVTGGLLGSKRTFSELKDIYSGKQQVEVKSSRWWEAGGTPFEGGEIDYYRPSQYYMMMNRVREKGIWGEDEDKISPIGKFLRKNFTYALERRNYYDRPYPISSAAFEDVPIIGSVLASTIGKLIKPPKIMHASEWMRMNEEGNIEYAHTFEGSRREPALDLGATRGIPTNPYSITNQLSFLNYQFRELEGMTGWAKNVIQQTITGEDIWAASKSQLASASAISSPNIRFWEMQMGGGLFANEFLRRVLPHARSEIERVNPVANSMPSWLPDKFKWGDPYRSVEWGEGRLPGPGYAAMHPELENVDPEAYPLLYRYSILSDVAPFSPEYSAMKEQVYALRSQGVYNQNQVAFMEQIDKQHSRKTRGFTDDRIDPNATRLPGSSITRGAWGVGQRVIRKAVAPVEYVIPMGFRPTQKLWGDRDPIEQYEYERLYGTQMAFWDKPWRDWLRPSMYSTLHMMGWQGKPLWRHNADSTNEYFDKLEFIKWMSLKQQAEAMGDGNAAAKYKWAAANTRSGINPQGNPLGIYWTLPEDERKFFNSFALAKTRDRNRILDMVPSDQVDLYKALWSRIDAGDTDLWGGAEPSVISDNYLQQQFYQAQQYMQGRPEPSPDWIGWHEDVDMSDIKVQYIDRLAGELHDYGMWDSQLKKSYQQPMLDGATDYIMPRPTSILSKSLGYMTGVPGRRGTWQSTEWGAMSNNIQVDYNDDRMSDISSAIGRYINEY